MMPSLPFVDLKGHLVITLYQSSVSLCYTFYSWVSYGRERNQLLPVGKIGFDYLKISVTFAFDFKKQRREQEQTSTLCTIIKLQLL